MAQLRAENARLAAIVTDLSTGSGPHCTRERNILFSRICERDAARSEVARLDEKLKEVEARESAARIEVNRLGVCLARKQRAIGLLFTIKNSYREKLATEQARTKELSESLIGIRGHCNKLGKQLYNAEEKSRELSEQVEKVVKERDEAVNQATLAERTWKLSTFCRQAEREVKDLTSENNVFRTKLSELTSQVAELTKEREEILAAFQKECDHDWRHKDDAFDHEFGTEQLHSCVCEKCGLTKPYEPETFGDEAI